MEFVKGLKETQRMCEDYCLCDGCPLSGKCLGLISGNGNGYGFSGFDKSALQKDFSNIAKVVEEWSKSHPPKTYRQDFLEKFPDAPLEDDESPKACVADIYKNASPNCGADEDLTCANCWNSSMEE